MQWLSQILSSLAQPLKWWIVIAPWEGGLRIRLGKVAGELGPGIHFRIPFLDRLYVQSLQLRLISDNGQTMTTSDGKVVTVAMGIEYGIGNLLRVYEMLANPETVLMYRVQGIIADHVTAVTASVLSPQTIEQAVTDNITVDEWGMDRLRLHITSFAFVRCYRLLGMNEYRAYTRVNESMEKGVSR